MNIMPGKSKKHLLAVVMWPVGGIRTYMKYTYPHFSPGQYSITILARETIEKQALLQDAESSGVKVVTVGQEKGVLSYIIAILRIHRCQKIDLIQSHGFLSALLVSFFSFFFRVKHVFTVHGVFEEHHLRQGVVGKVQKFLFRLAVNRVDCIHAVSQDILDHVVDELDVRDSVPKTVIYNGIDLARFCIEGNEKGMQSNPYRTGLADNAFLVGFVGRFMPQKGFEYLIEAVDLLRMDRGYSPEFFRVLAVGSGDYLQYYKKTVMDKGLDNFFLFIPFLSDIQIIYRTVDIIAMPSIWEACGLQALEALCMGTPIIVSNCIGLREVTRGTPALTIPSRDPRALADAIHESRISQKLTFFQQFVPEARARFDVNESVKKLNELFDRVCSKERLGQALHLAQLDWKFLDDEEYMDPQGIRLVSHERFTSDYFKRQAPVKVIEQGAVSRLLAGWESFSLLLWAIKILWVSDKRTVVLANGSNLLGNFICLVNYYLFFGTRNVLFWDSHLEPRTKTKKYFAKRCFLGCRLATMWSAHQVHNYSLEFNLPKEQFIFIPYKANHSKIGIEVRPICLDYIFAGGNGKRDYKTLIEAVRGTGITVIISSTKRAVRSSIEDLPNVIPLAATEPSYAKLMAASRLVVIPMASTGLKGGGEANFCNAMWHGKPIIAMDDVSAVDYIIDGETGYIVPPNDAVLLRQRILELWHDKEKCQRMGIKGKKRVEQYFTHDLCINRLIRLAYLVGKAGNSHKSERQASR